MKNKSPLTLMEQLLMILVFALAAALCLQGFALADRISRRLELRNQAVTMAQNAAELVKYYAGDFDQVTAQLDTRWDGTADGQISQSSLVLELHPALSPAPLLGTANILVFLEEEVIFEITAAWQEADPDEQ